MDSSRIIKVIFRGLACDGFFFGMLIVELIWTLLELLNVGAVLLLLP